jgi:P27 family predicted phage terminase small subunit
MRHRGRKSANELAMTAYVNSTSPDEHTQPSSDLRPPPNHLTAATQAWWRAIVGNFPLEQHQMRTLQAAAESWDRYQQARQSLAEHGLTFTDNKGMIRARPECAIERDSRIAYIRAVRELGFDKELAPPKDHNSRVSAYSPWRHDPNKRFG